MEARDRIIRFVKNMPAHPPGSAQPRLFYYRPLQKYLLEFPAEKEILVLMIINNQVNCMDHDEKERKELWTRYFGK